MRWRCSYHNSKGDRCRNTAVLRLQYGSEHPFDFVDVCFEHRLEYKSFSWFHILREDWNDKTGESSEDSSSDATVLSTNSQTGTEKEETES